MKICRICKLEYKNEATVCARCGATLERVQEEWVSPQTFEIEY